MKKYITSATVVLAMLFVSKYYNTRPQSLTSQLKNQIAALQLELPSKIDGVSTTVAASFENNILSYDIELNLQVDNNSLKQLQSTQRNSNILAACLNKNLLPLLDEIDAIEYNYFIKSSQIRFNTSVNASDCQPFASEDSNVVGEYYVQLQNSTLPLTVDSETNLIRYRKEGNTITLDYQLHSWLLSELNVPYFKSMTDSEVAPLMCQAPDFKALFQLGYEVRVRYLDSRHDTIYITTVPKERC